MERKKLRIDKYEWELEVYFAVSCYHTDDIMMSLERVDCTPDIKKRVYDNLLKCDMDTGFTYSNKRLRSTVMVIGLSSSPAQFLNSFEHELRHFVDDISDTYGISDKGEEVAYLTGDINSALWRDIHKFLCCKCRY